MMKAQFMSLWDGFNVDSKSKVIVMGATNRKFQIDEAILSRMELQFEVKLPNLSQRKKILNKMLKSISIDTDVHIDEIASLMNSFSGRDIDDVCREASMKCLRDYLSNLSHNSDSSADDYEDDEDKIRKVNRADFISAINLKKRDFNRIID